jgi:hypothetical protein
VLQAALEMGMEISKVKGALQRKIQQTGQPFLTTEALLEAVLGRDEYESDHDTDTDEDNYEDEDVSSRTRPYTRRSVNYNIPQFTGTGSISTSEASSSSSAEHSSSSGDEQETTSNPPIPTRSQKTPASRSASGDSGVSTMSSEAGDERQVESDEPSSLNCPSSRDVKGISQKSTSEKNSNESNHLMGECVSLEGSENKGNSRSLTMNEFESSTPLIVKDVLINDILYNFTEEMQEELRKLREATQCKICMDNKVQVVFLPCGHLVSCTRCATALSNCAVCRQPIKAYVKTYLS